jgi:hypothetical protein
MVSPARPIEQHPDIVALRMRYDQAAQRPTTQVVDGASFLAALYLAASPWILGFVDLTTLAVTNLIAGTALALLAVGFASAYGRTHGIAWVAPVIGAWTVIAPWAVRGNVDTATTITSNAIVGGLTVLLGLAAIAMGMREARR